MVGAVVAGQQGVDLDRPDLRGRQCRIITWITHSITGKSAMSPAGISSSHQEPPPTTTRATMAATRNVEIRNGLGWLQNDFHAWPSETFVRRLPVIRSSSLASRSAAMVSISG